VEPIKEVVFNKKVWVPCQESFRFTESVDLKGKKQYILSGLMLPFGKISRNNVLYNESSVVEKHGQLKDRPLMYNHLVEGEHLPKGHFVASEILYEPKPGYNFTAPGWYYKADVDPDEKDLIRKIERGDLKNVSIQLLGGKVLEKLGDDGRRYVEAYVQDVIEGSIVVAPGFLDTTASFAEAFGAPKVTNGMTERAMVEAVMESPVEAGAKVEAEHRAVYDKIAKALADTGKLPSPEEVFRWIAEDHIAEIPDYYVRLAKMEAEAKASKEEVSTATASGAIGGALLPQRKKEDIELAEKFLRELPEPAIAEMLRQRGVQ
jgi:hypothetical protein